MDQNKTIGIIGGGNMGGGIISGIVSSGLVAPEHVIASDININGLEHLKESYGIRTTTNNVELCQEADIIFLVVKPHLLSVVVPEIRDVVNADALVVSVAAGRSISYIESLFDRQLKLVRIMPNLGAVVGESMTGFTGNALVDEDDLMDVQDILSSFGRCEQVPENLLDIVTGVSGSAPAYICTMLDAMADAAVLNGLPRAKAYTFAAQAMLGTAKYLLEMQTTPSALKDMVCTPGGTSIVAVAEMERLGIRSAIMAGVTACTEKSIAMAAIANGTDSKK